MNFIAGNNDQKARDRVEGAGVPGEASSGCVDLCLQLRTLYTRELRCANEAEKQTSEAELDVFFLF